jgi:hypothetical protein
MELISMGPSLEAKMHSVPYRCARHLFSTAIARSTILTGCNSAGLS